MTESATTKGQRRTFSSRHDRDLSDELISEARLALLAEIEKDQKAILEFLLQHDHEVLHAVSWKSMTIGEAHELEKFYQGQAEGYNAFYRKAMEFLEAKRESSVRVK